MCTVCVSTNGWRFFSCLHFFFYSVYDCGRELNKSCFFFFWQSFVLITSLMRRNVSIILSSVKQRQLHVGHKYSARWKAKPWINFRIVSANRQTSHTTRNQQQKKKKKKKLGPNEYNTLNKTRDGWVVRGKKKVHFLLREHRNQSDHKFIVLNCFCVLNCFFFSLSFVQMNVHSYATATS